MLKKLIQSFRSPLRRSQHPRSTPEVLSNRQHSLERADISRNAVNVVERLQKAGYQAYLVGGCVRDLLLNLEPKDFDVATSATPEQVRAEFRNARVIGRRFKLVHVHFGREIIETATFRANHPRVPTRKTATSPRATRAAASCGTTSTATRKKTRSAATSP
ncbi:hypothetical protein PHLH8_51590 [Pseudomonas sp. Pc102]|nr:hypothetical protein PHLH8_51590 [Pseudomonas sp. Pc102]